MIKKIVLPKLGLTATEGRVMQWLQPVGAAVVKGEPLFSVETEKSNIDIECPVDGVLLQAVPAGGDPIPMGCTIGFIATEGETTVPAELLADSVFATAPAEATAEPAAASAAAPAAAAPVAEAEGGRGAKASPLAKKVAVELGVNLDQVIGTGPGGRITKEDVLAAAANPAPAAAPAATAAPQAQQPVVYQGSVPSRTVAQSRFGRIAAKRLTESKQTIPHWYINFTVDMSALLQLREQLLPALAAQGAKKLTVTDLLVKAVALTLAKHPLVNATYTDADLQVFEQINIGLAVDTPNGLAVPVIAGADQKSLTEISSAVASLSERAKEMKLLPEEVSGATFTISNLGMFGVNFFAAIIDPPQSGILAVGGIVKQAVVVDDAIVIRPTMSLTLSVDHRVVDGGEAARFMRDLKNLLENPYILVL